MLVLGMDSATTACSAAVLRDGKLLAHEFERMVRGQAEALVPMIGRVLEVASSSATELDLIAATIGPGAYTGVRIGLSTARTISLAAGVPLVGVTTMEAVARAAGPSVEDVIVVMETKRADFYVQMFRADGTTVADPAAMTAFELKKAFPGAKVRLVGDAAERAADVFRESGRRVDLVSSGGLPDAIWVAMAGAERAGEARIGAATPLYLRPPDVGSPKVLAK
ncbi:MAG: tRNA threonylcarbamoyladenosine biosynthesis protein TsaB [Alphaproteobacteria bacterium MarineAlpha4_Bin2]|nr:MAG: tRNA threonylcarbamoyladenosine biosynthesis protein TsaB [Alphaproteobacteria bacterium MarineAlpha4_Bin2]